MRNVRNYRRQFLTGLGFVLLVLIAIILFFNAGELAQQLGSFPLWLLGPMVALKFINWGFRYWEWHYFLQVLGVEISPQMTTQPSPDDDTPPRLSLRDSVVIWTAGLPVAISPGKVAEVLKSIILKNLAGVPVSRSAPVVFAERLVDGLAVILLAAVSGLLISDSLLQAEAVSTGYVQGVLGLTILALLALMVAIQWRPAASWLLKHWGRLPVVWRLQDALRAFYNSSYDLIKGRHMLPTIGMGLIGYLCDGVIFYLVLIGLGQPPSWTLLGQSIFILGFSVIVAALSAMPGGAGGRELTVGVLLTALVGMPRAAIGAAVLMVGFFQIWFGTLLGLILIFIFRRTLFAPGLSNEDEQTYPDPAPSDDAFPFSV